MAIDDDDRPEGAGSEAIDRLEGELPVGGRLAGLDAQLALELIDHPRRTANVTRRAEAGGNDVPAPGLQREAAVERRDAVDVHQRAAGLVGHHPQDLLGEITVFLRCREQVTMIKTINLRLAMIWLKVITPVV